MDSATKRILDAISSITLGPPFSFNDTDFLFTENMEPGEFPSREPNGSTILFEDLSGRTPFSPSSMAESTTQYPPASIQYGTVKATTADFFNLTNVIVEEATIAEATIDFNEPIIDGSVGTIPRKPLANDHTL